MAAGHFNEVERIHFLNSCFSETEVYSCAVDAFLELSYSVIWKYLDHFDVTSGFWGKLRRVCRSYSELVFSPGASQHILIEQDLAFIREQIWIDLCNFCLSFSDRTCNAQFSEIFSSVLFNIIKDLGEKNLFHSSYTLTSFCINCHKDVISDCEVLVHYISEDIVNSNKTWADSLDPQWNNTSLQCTSCCTSASPVTVQQYTPSQVLFVEFASSLMQRPHLITSELVVCGSIYQLKAQVRHVGSHFSSAVLLDGFFWLYIDDLSLTCKIFGALGDLHALLSEGWFFFVYELVPSKSLDIPMPVELIRTEETFSNTICRKRKYFLNNRDQINKRRRINYNLKKNMCENKKAGISNHFKTKRKSPASKIKIKRSKSAGKIRINRSKSASKMKVDSSETPCDRNTKQSSSDVQNEFLCSFEINCGENLHKQPWAVKNMKKFHESMKMKITMCVVCHEAWPIKQSNKKCGSQDFVCLRCNRDKGTPKKFSRENDMIPCDVPAELRNLTQVEEMLIARAFPVIQVYIKPRGGQRGYKGHVITLPQDVEQFAKILPRVPADIPIILIKFRGNNEFSKEFKVRRQKVLDALLWLTGVNEQGEPNNVVYKDVVIDYERVAKLPEEDFLVQNMRTVDYDNNFEDDNLPDVGPPDDSKVFDENSEIFSFLPSKVNVKKEADIVKDSIFQENETHEWEVGSTPLNEFSTRYLATMCFPSLFPDAAGDPLNNGTIRSISSNETAVLSEKIKHLIKFAELIDGKWVYRFASHPRFAFWAYNILYRRRLLGQGSFFIKQNPGDAFLSLSDLQEMASHSTYSSLMTKLMRYAKNVCGTNSYWHEAKNQLKATINQVGAPTVFWTLSCAELHWPEFHSMISSDENEDFVTLRNNVICNPHLLDWFFTQRTENFVKYWLYDTLNAEWHWFRFEYAVQRGSIHCHGVAKLKNDPGICSLSNTALKGFLANKENENSSDPMVLEAVAAGKDAERTICNYLDFLMTACNPQNPDSDMWVKPKIHPCKKDFLAMREIDFEDDYTDLVNSVQRHTQCSSAYCLRKTSSGEQYCRFHFPMPLQNATKLEYEKVRGKTSEYYRISYSLKRNDTRLNKHQRLQIQSWRANCDIQPILDYHACLQYLAKYASKGEKVSSVIKDAFMSVSSKTSNTDSSRRIIQRLLMKSLGERDWSIQEVMHQILSLKLVSSFFDVITVSLEGSRRISIRKDLAVTQPSSLDIYANRHQYENFKTEMFNCNLVQFTSKYKIVNKKIVTRPKPVVVRFFPTVYANPNDPKYPNYCKYQLIKFKPWSQYIYNAYGGVDTSEESYCTSWNSFLQSADGVNLVPDHSRELAHAQIYFNQCVQVDESDDDHVEMEVTREDWMSLAELQFSDPTLLSSVPFGYWDSSHTVYSSTQIESIPSWISEAKSLSGVEQTQSLLVPCHLSDLNDEQRLAVNIVLNHDPNKQLLMMIMGQAGSGKSYVINYLRARLGRRCAVSAFFGIAAFNISGKTLHSLLKLPIRGKHQCELKGTALLRVQEAFSDVPYLIIDEYSVIGQALFGWIDRRCRQVTGYLDIPFGGLNVILVGDPAQLPPVGDNVLNYPFPSNSVSTQGYLAYQLFKTVVKLEVNQRSLGQIQEQKEFRDILINLRNGESTVDDWKLLLTRKVPEDVSCLDSYVKLSFSNEEVNRDNYHSLKKLGEPIARIDAIHSTSQGKKLSAEDIGGLEPTIYLALGARVMLTKNIWPEKGLCNGSMGYVKHIVYKEGESPPSLPMAVIVKFDKGYVGPSFDHNENNLVPITPQACTSESLGEEHERQQLPLKLAWSITIHKSQGLTIDKAWVNLGSKESCAGLAYVALSRVRALKDLFVDPMTFERLTAVSKGTNFCYRIEEEKRLTELSTLTKQRFHSSNSEPSLVDIEQDGLPIPI